LIREFPDALISSVADLGMISGIAGIGIAGMFTPWFALLAATIELND
jgi:hypothetical protein